MVNSMRELYGARELLFTWAMRDFKVRYSQSVLGVAWAILQPLSLMLIFSLVFLRFLNVPTDGIPYPVFAYCALLVWTFLANSLTLAIPSLVNNMNIVSKIYFPREILPLSSVIISVADLFVATSIFIPMMLFYHISISWTFVMILPLLCIQIILILGICLFASAINVFYRDIRFVVPLVLQLWMYLSPVIYPASIVPVWLRPFYFLNPMAVLIESYRKVILMNQMPDWNYLILATTMSLALLLFAYRYFKKSERVFADLI